MQKIFFSGKNLSRILKLKNKIERKLKIKLIIRRDGIYISGISAESFDEYIIAKIIEAISLGFNIEEAMQLGNTDYSLNQINIKDLIKKSRLKAANARVIGKKGKTRKIIEELSSCSIVIDLPHVYILGRAENVETAMKAIVSLIHGSKQSNIYNYLEKNKARLRALEEENVAEFINK